MKTTSERVPPATLLCSRLAAGVSVFKEPAPTKVSVPVLISALTGPYLTWPGGKWHRAAEGAESRQAGAELCWGRLNELDVPPVDTERPLGVLAKYSVTDLTAMMS